MELELVASWSFRRAFYEAFVLAGRYYGFNDSTNDLRLQYWVLSAVNGLLSIPPLL